MRGSCMRQLETVQSMSARRETIAVLPHPDDELMIAQMLTQLAEDGESIRAVALTDGGASTEFHLPGDLPDQHSLSMLRADEHMASLEYLKIITKNASSYVDRLRLPDGGLASGGVLHVAINALIRHGARGASSGRVRNQFLTLGPKGFDEHIDHKMSDMAARIASRALFETSGIVAPVIGLSRSGEIRLDVGDEGVRRKLEIMRRHRSQFPDPYLFMNDPDARELPTGEFYDRFFDIYGYRELFEQERFTIFDPSRQ